MSTRNDNEINSTEVAEMEAGQFKYDAFISYRHCEPDQYVAMTLHKEMEKFKLPANVAKKILQDNPNAKTRITRVFRDQEELPLATNLADPIIEALKSSEWLIVICSPRLKESMWCRKEIETFIKLRGRDKVMVVLAEGEPSDSFPEEVLKREVEVTLQDGSKQIVYEATEPLAADVRGEDEKERLKAIKSEMIRLMAPMFNLGYDELRQRHRERKIRRIVAFASIVAIVSLLFAIVSTFSALTISRQKDEIEKQAKDIEGKAVLLEQQNIEIKTDTAKNLAEDANNYLLSDDRENAIKKAYTALVSYNGIVLPYTDEARYALMNALRPYDISGTDKAVYQFIAKGIVKDTAISPLRTVVYIYDGSDRATFWNVKENKVIHTMLWPDMVYNDKTVLFISEDKFLYAVDGDIHILDITSGEDKIVKSFDDTIGISRIRYSIANDIVYIAYLDKVYGYQGENFRELFEFTNPDRENVIEVRQQENNYVSFVSVLDSENYTIRLLNSEGELVFEKVISDGGYKGSYLSGDDFFVLSANTERINGTLAGIKSVVSAFSVKTGEKKWTREDLSIYGNALCEISENDRSSVIEVGDFGIVEMDKESGEAINICRSEGRIIWTGLYGSCLAYLTDRAEESYYVDHTTMGDKNKVNYNLGLADYAEKTEDGYVIVPYNSNRVIYYAPTTTNVTECENYNLDLENEKGKYHNTKNLIAGIDDEEIDKLKLADRELIRNVAFDDSNKYMLVSRKDSVAMLFDASSKELLSSWNINDSSTGLNQYLGKDKEGNSYWANALESYCLSKDNKVIASIDFLRAIDNDRYILGFEDSPERYEAPIYSLDELLEMANEIK